MSLIPAGWHFSQVGATGNVMSGRQRSPHLTSGALTPYLRVANVLDGWINYVDVNAMPFTSSEVEKYRLVPGDILLNEGQSINLVGRAAMFQDTEKTYCFQNTLIRYRAGDDVEPDFALQLFRFSQAQGIFSQIAVRTNSIAHLGVSRFSELELRFPPLSEQRKIAEILRAWDDAIERTETLMIRVRGKHRLLLQGLIARHAHGSHVALRDLVEPVKTKNTVGETNVLTSSARDGLVSQTEYFNKSVAGKNLAGYYLLHRDDFAYNRSSSAGHPFGAIRRLDRYDRGIISTLYLCFRLRKNSQMSGIFLQNIFNSEVLDRQLSPICHEGARSHGLLNIAQADFFELVVPVPSREAQEIANKALAASSLEIELLKRKAELLRTQKRGLMQKLLTGQVRVNVAAETEPGGQDND